MLPATNTSTLIHILIHTHTYIQVRTCIHNHINTHTYVYTIILIRTCMHTHTHTRSPTAVGLSQRTGDHSPHVNPGSRIRKL